MAENEGPRMDEFIGRTDWFDPELPQEQFDAMVNRVAADHPNSVRCEQLTRMVKNMRAAVAQWNKAYESEAADVDLGGDDE